MSNKLKTISAGQLEHLISKAVSEYVNEDCDCKVTNLDTENFDYEDNVGVHNKRKIEFKVSLNYYE